MTETQTDTDTITDANSDPEQLADSRCPLCQWIGLTHDDVCPRCGYGLVEYEVLYHG